MSRRTDLYDSTYGRFSEDALAAVRAETYGQDIGQNSWTTAEEYARFATWLRLDAGRHVLEVACGSGGPALHLARTTGCRVTGIDTNEHGIATARQLARGAAGGERATFQVADANSRLPFEDGTFDGIVCIDAVNHLPDRGQVLREWRRVLRPGGRIVFTDPVVLRGPVTSEEVARRSSIGTFVYVAPGVNEELIAAAGLKLVQSEDTSAEAAAVAGRWHRARESRRAELVGLEGAERFEGLQVFLRTVEKLTREGRLNRIVYRVEFAVA